jgi:hypothetical protein
MNIIADTEKVALTIIKEYDIINKMNVIYNDNIKSGIIEIKINILSQFHNFILICNNIRIIGEIADTNKQINKIIEIGVSDICTIVFNYLSITIRFIKDIMKYDYIDIYSIIYKFIWYYLYVKEYKDIIKKQNNDNYNYICNLSEKYNFNNIFLIQLWKYIELFNNEFDNTRQYNIPKEYIIALLDLINDKSLPFYTQLKLIKKYMKEYNIQAYYNHNNTLTEKINKYKDQINDIHLCDL